MRLNSSRSPAGPVANKNDQCYVEQKNGSVVRQLVGYDRFEGERAYRQLAELYRAVRLYVNFFQPSMKLRTKTRTGSRVRRRYGPAQTPFQRVLASGVLDAASQRRLNAVYRALDPVRLLHQLENLQEALWRHALFRTRGSSPTNELMALRFDLRTCAAGDDEADRGDHRSAAPGRHAQTQVPTYGEIEGPADVP